uniref:Uncharacterized protein n=1 Tax=Avena sativa TaxID=4498 RepID=A0ACD5XTY5_AVESA
MAIRLLILVQLVLPLVAAAPRSLEAAALHPIVLVPGYATNELDARLTELYRPSSPRCGERKGKGWFRLYLNYSALQDPANVPCFAEQMSSVYDAASDDYYNVPGVETRVPSFGSTQAFRFPDPDRKNFSYMNAFVERLEKMGYRDGETMFGAPYDFRYVVAPAGRPSKAGDAFLRALKGLVERASRLNGGRPVTIVTHSNGGPLTHQLLVRQPLAWRRRFVRRFLPIAAPWGGIVVGMLLLVSGNNYGLPFVDARALLAAGRSQSTSIWWLPSPSPAVFGTTQPLVVTRSRNYSAGDVAEYLVDIGLGEAVGPYESRVLPLFGAELPPPGVPVTNIVGVGVGTTERIVYPGDGFHGTPDTVAGDGDGVVNLASALAVETQWKKDYRLVKVSNVTHNGLVADDRALDIVIREIQRAN